MALYRKKPVVVEALQFRGPQVHDVAYMTQFDDWMVANQGDARCRYRGATLIIPTLEGEMTAQPGDWIIRGVKGELYPCKPDIFAEIYEPVECDCPAGACYGQGVGCRSISLNARP